MDKGCKVCNNLKPLSDFRQRNRKNGRTYYENNCKTCECKKSKIRSKQRYKDKIEWYREYTKNNKVKRNTYDKVYSKNNQERLKEYRKNRRAQDNKNQRIWAKCKRKDDPTFRLRQYVSCTINNMLRKNGSSKAGKSCLNYLDYTFKELKKHIEAQFEPWMTWENHGRYEVKIWDDRDSSTWTWQLDHIIPHSRTPYESMDSEEFRKCWDLSNLRPLSAKKNLIDGTRLTRHKQTFKITT